MSIKKVLSSENIVWRFTQIFASFFFMFFAPAMASELNIYSHRQPFLINPFLESFTKETGIKTNVVYSTKGLAQRLKSEGKNSPADVILTVDIGRLQVYADMKLLAKINSKINTDFL